MPRPCDALVIAGRQEVRINGELRELTVSGVIRPEDVTANNTINHTQIAEARISYGGRGQISAVQRPNWGQRIADAVADRAPAASIAALRLRLVEVLDTVGDRDSALGVLDQLLGALPEYVPALERLVQFAAQDPDPRIHAEALLRLAAVDDGPDQLGLLVEAARRYRVAGDLRRCAHTFERATDRVSAISSACIGRPAWNSSAWICATVRFTPQREPISPQCRMKRRLSGDSGSWTGSDEDDMAAAFRTAHVATVASIEPEAFGRAATEAQVMGTPVIATDIGAPPETVMGRPGVEAERATGWLVPPEDSERLAAAIAEALAMSPEERARMGARARNHVLKSFSLKQMKQQTLQVYDGLLGTHLAEPV